MAGREPILRVIMGPYLSLKSCKMGSSSKNDFRSHIKLPIIGTVMGPGGSFLEDENRKDLSMADMQSVRMITNQVSIFFFFLFRV